LASRVSWVGGAESFRGGVGPIAHRSQRDEIATDWRIDPLSNHWPFLVAEQLDGERLVISQLRPRAGAVADLADELVLFVFLSAGQHDGRRAADAVCSLIGVTPH